MWNCELFNPNIQPAVRFKDKRKENKKSSYSWKLLNIFVEPEQWSKVPFDQRVHQKRKSENDKIDNKKL